MDGDAPALTPTELKQQEERTACWHDPSPQTNTIRCGQPAGTTRRRKLTLFVRNDSIYPIRIRNDSMYPISKVRQLPQPPLLNNFSLEKAPPTLEKCL